MALVLGSCELVVIEPVYDPRNQRTGSYEVEEYSETGNSTYRYSMRLSKAGNYELWLNNFYDAGIQVRAELNGDKIFIPWQMHDGYEIEGVGTFYGDNLSLSYKVRDTYNQYRSDFCKAEAWRQW